MYVRKAVSWALITATEAESCVHILISFCSRTCFVPLRRRRVPRVRPTYVMNTRGLCFSFYS